MVDEAEVQADIEEMPGPKDIHAPQSTATASADVSCDVSTDIVEMDGAAGQFIRDAGNPRERDLYPMLKKLGKQYTQKQIRTWKKHYGHAADAASATISGQTASSSSAGVQLMTDVQSVSADIQEMEKKVGPFIRSKGNPQESVLYAMLKGEDHHYTLRQLRLWKKHYGVTEPVAEELKDIDAEVAVSQYRDDVTSCVNLGHGYKRLMTGLLSKGVLMTEHQARLALIQVSMQISQKQNWNNGKNLQIYWHWACQGRTRFAISPSIEAGSSLCTQCGVCTQNTRSR